MRSIRARLLGATALWTILSLVVSGVFLSEAFRRTAERGLSSLVVAHSYNVIGALSRDETGRLVGQPDMGDPRFDAPLSGWSWSISEGEGDAAAIRSTSASLGGETLTLPGLDVVPFEDFRRTFRTLDASGQPITVTETQILVDEGEAPVSITVSASMAEIEMEVAEFRTTLALFFTAFGLGLLGATAVIVRFGLKPLARIRAELAAIREGAQETITGEQPREVEPLVREVNALLASNRDIVERARRQVGNLAHALKTPLAVIRNEAESNGASGIVEQADEMRRNVDTYLNRARIAAVRDTAHARTPVAPVVETLTRVLGRLHDERAFEAGVTGEPVFAGERQDLEEVLGNLMENAARFAASHVTVSAHADGNRLTLEVADDGPGMSAEERSLATTRGVRLDQRRSQSGLGLSIVRDIVEAYEGELAFDEAEGGGLAVKVALPAVT